MNLDQLAARYQAFEKPTTPFSSARLAYCSRYGYCHLAVREYVECLSESRTFTHWTLEDVWEVVRRNSQKEWINAFADRYLAFGKIDASLRQQACGG